jgi:hypothetical protein
MYEETPWYELGECEQTHTGNVTWWKKMLCPKTWEGTCGEEADR